MIKEDDLLDAIKECQREKNPNANTCIKLAAYYTIHREMYGTKETPQTHDRLSFTSGRSDFAKAAEGKPEEFVWEVIDELMDTLQILNPKLYDSVMEKFTQ